MTNATRVTPSAESREGNCSTCLKVFRQMRVHYSNGEWSQWQPSKCDNCSTSNSERQTQERRKAARLRDLNIPPLYETATIATFSLHGSALQQDTLRHALLVATTFIAEWPRPHAQILLFRGGPGTGKGHLAWATARETGVEHGASVKFIKLPGLVRDLREAWRHGEGPSEEERLKRYRQPDLLVIDEVSRHAFYGEPTRHLYDVLDDRCDWLRPTILTTNESESGIADILGPALLDRLVGYGGLVEFGNESYRQRTTTEPQP